MFEWQAAINIIKSQTNRSLGEILHDHSTETFHKQMGVKNRQALYRQREKRLNYGFNFYIWILIPGTLIFQLVVNQIHYSQIVNIVQKETLYLYWTYQIILEVFMVYTFVRLYRLMSKLHF